MADHELKLVQVECTSEDCAHKDECVLQVRLDGDFFPKIEMAHSEPTASDPDCHGDLEILCTQFKKKEKKEKKHAD